MYASVRSAKDFTSPKLVGNENSVATNVVLSFIIESASNLANTPLTSARRERKVPKKVTMGKRKIEGKRK